jgi:hypothetical protein
MAGTGGEIAEPQVPMAGTDVCLVQHADLAAAVTLDAKEP